jgi:hypothetical protein
MRLARLAGLVELADDATRALTAEADRLQHLADVEAAQPGVAYGVGRSKAAARRTRT